MQEAYGELRQRRIHLPSPARSDEGSSGLASESKADEFGITPRHLNIEEDDTCRIRCIFRMEYARQFARRRQRGQLPVTTVQARITEGSLTNPHPRRRQRPFKALHYNVAAIPPRRSNGPHKIQSTRRPAATGVDAGEKDGDISVMLPARVTRRAANQTSQFFELDARGRLRQLHAVRKF